MKKFIIGTLGVLFASAIAVAVWASNVKANDLLAMNISALAYSEYVSGEYHQGTPGTNWKTYTVYCRETQETYEYATNSGFTNGLDSGASVSISDPYNKGSVSVSGSATGTSYYNHSERGSLDKGSETSSAKDVCGKGFGACIFGHTPDASNPCM